MNWKKWGRIRKCGLEGPDSTGDRHNYLKMNNLSLSKRGVDYFFHPYRKNFKMALFTGPACSHCTKCPAEGTISNSLCGMRC